jgi:hypothetical protein
VVRNEKDYIDLLKEEYPDIDKKILEKIIVKGLKGIQHLVHADMDVRIGNNTPNRSYKMTIVRPMATWDALMKRAKEKKFQLLRRRKKYVK